MNIEYINPFIEASQLVLGSVASLPVKLGRAFIRKAPFGAGMPLVEVGLTGKISGKGVLAIPIPVAKQIISRMMGGMEIAEIDELGVSALSELANMIMGNTATILYNRGVGIDITTPRMAFGDGAAPPPAAGAQTISVPLAVGELGDIELDISVAG
jgi:chemotaxis protein CheX